MAFVKLTFMSGAVRGQEEVSVFLPNALDKSGPGRPKKLTTWDKQEKYQVLWLMHGGGDDHNAWPLSSMIKRVCEDKNIIVVMPNIRDMLSGHPAIDTFTYVTQELPEFIGFLFPISRKRENNFIAGLSYGGYFAYRCALNFPENYACVGSFSSPLDVKMDIERGHKGHPYFDLPIEGTNRDLFGMASALKESGRPIPRMFQTVGTEDFTWDFNISARDKFRAMGLDHTWTQRPGIHNFEFWDPALKEFLEWLPLTGAPVKEED